jgi:UPF0716 family protein affecting phage T7 exclusion
MPRTGDSTSRTVGRRSGTLLQSTPMTHARLLLRFRDRDFLFRTILILLGFALVPLAEIVLFVFLGTVIGNYLVLIIAVAVGMIGGFVVLSQARRTEARLRELAHAGAWPGRELADCTGLLVAAVLLITPGFITDCAGLVLLVPSLRKKAGKLLSASLSTKFRELYDQLSLSRL